MQNNIISLKEALAVMAKKDENNRLIPFDVTYRTFNATSKKGGKLKFYPAAKLCLEANPNKITKDTAENIMDKVAPIKNPAHFDNRTRNIELQTGEIVKLRIDFVISINNQKIIY